MASSVVGSSGDLIGSLGGLVGSSVGSDISATGTISGEGKFSGVTNAYITGTISGEGKFTGVTRAYITGRISGEGTFLGTASIPDFVINSIVGSNIGSLIGSRGGLVGPNVQVSPLSISGRIRGEGIFEALASVNLTVTGRISGEGIFSGYISQRNPSTAILRIGGPSIQATGVILAPYSGLYYIKVDKQNDTVFATIEPVATSNKKISADATTFIFTDPVNKNGFDPEYN